MRGLQFICKTEENALNYFETAEGCIKGDGVLPLLAYICVLVPRRLRSAFFNLIRNRDASTCLNEGVDTLRPTALSSGSLVDWYRRSGINDLSNADALKVIFWHFYKIVNPFSSLYKMRRQRR